MFDGHPAFQSSRPWVDRMHQAETYDGLNQLVDDWYETLGRAHALHNASAFDASMEARDWERAKRSIESTFGRDSSDHRDNVDTLSAAIQNRSGLRLRIVN
jgi:hypothetical protein